MSLHDFPELTKLSNHQKLELVEELWNSIRSEATSIPIPPSHKKELDHRVESIDEIDLLTLSELKSRIQNRK